MVYRMSDFDNLVASNNIAKVILQEDGNRAMFSALQAEIARFDLLTPWYRLL
jgi:hypothetical protein